MDQMKILQWKGNQIVQIGPFLEVCKQIIQLKSEHSQGCPIELYVFALQPFIPIPRKINKAILCNS
ncbi:hypothetical protein NQZ71_23670 (plasmid) [Niallia taxi]|uniref:hypothetical protein n=1 Tax=Niallia taxi TaxID=2499688 RepID=UPI0029343005|nr:hypothetical protein [Niallia taxi]WOD64924.1 hypothetical protein NQZ71_23670 [Niallia taxi]